jgi:hypothetical protein
MSKWYVGSINGNQVSFQAKSLEEAYQIMLDRCTEDWFFTNGHDTEDEAWEQVREMTGDDEEDG